VNRAARRILQVLLAGIVAVPVALVATLLMFPFWSWFERVTGIESLGHSGPADWCYGAVYAVLLAIFALAAGVRGRRGA